METIGLHNFFSDFVEYSGQDRRRRSIEGTRVVECLLASFTALNTVQNNADEAALFGKLEEPGSSVRGQFGDGNTTLLSLSRITNALARWMFLVGPDEHDIGDAQIALFRAFSDKLRVQTVEN
ncbi:hypothetical protein RUM44_013697 [Polyplax serrata]|uniref:Uncharacterized protein n=1 Tax=Polyplax serrata TaxID=468196 RepID=A0ABR1BIJ0_POLSC